MKKQVILFPTIFGLILAGLVLYFAFGKTSVYAQINRVSRIVKTEPVTSGPAAENSASLARFAAAASQNSRLRSSLVWSFGKAQTGWEIYVPLVSQTIGTDASPDSAQFASALSKWQTKNSLQATGILDADTLGAFIKFWQSQRFHGGNASDSDLVQAPISDFYDPARSPDLLNLERDTYAAYKRMIAAAAKELHGQIKVTKSGDLAPDEKFLRIVSAYRSPEYQAQLRAREPGAGRIALAKNSVHFTGRALDLYVGGEPTTTKDPNRMIQVQTPVYKWLVKNAHRFGFYPYFYEPWHWEYVPGK
jgi:uncharacterized protein YcbK (DUF882 family)